MSTLDQYVSAATRDHTRRSYRAAIRHFEEAWGGFLPATAESIARYLADHAATLALNTLRLRLAALAQWHADQGFSDPTKAPLVKKVLKGIGELHPVRERQARPLRLARDRALVLIGFWRGFRADELCRLQVEHIDVVAGEGMVVYLP